MHQEIREVTGKKWCTSSGCIRSKDGSIILEQMDILDRWTEYLEDMFDDERGDKPVIRKELEGPSIMKEEVQFALQNIKNNKATGPDNIVVEPVKELNDFGVEKVAAIANKIYNTGHIPPDLSKSVFIALPKQPGASECELELHRTISLMSHNTKLILRILLNRMKTKIRREISQEQNAYMKVEGYQECNLCFENVG